MYWSVDNPQSMSAHCKPCGMPIFIKVGSPDMYGTPILEYPGLVKVIILLECSTYSLNSVFSMRTVVVICSVIA